jgi:precorrin-6A/cobalt-precorrin-6A reductase
MMTSATDKMRVLVLGGTSEASALAEMLAADHRFDAVLSLAGRTANPKLPSIAVRVGGFGGVDGLVDYVRRENVDVVVDATHPFAAQISAHAIAACERADVRLIALERAPWAAVEGDDWQHFSSVEDAIAALPHRPVRVFSGLGRLSLDALEAAPQHHYLIRVIDPILRPLALANFCIVTARGPFSTDDDIQLFKEHRIDVVLAKNAGGSAAVAKIAAARALGLPVMMIDRPDIPERPVVSSVEAVMCELAEHHASPAKRGV